MDKAIAEKILKAIEVQNKQVQKTVELLGRIDENIKNLNKKTNPSDLGFLKNTFDKAMFASIVTSLDKIHDLLKSKFK